MAIVDYTGRTVDLLFAENWKEIGSFNILSGLGNELRVCTGIQKLAQTVALMLMTRQGTVLSDPLFGSTLLNRIEAGVTSEAQVVSLFNLAASEVRSYLRRITPATAPDDEQIDSIELESMFYSAGQLTMSVKVNSLAGESRAVIVPVGVPIK